MAAVQVVIGNMKVYVVLDNFQGTDSDCDCGVPVTVWFDKDLAEQEAKARYAHSIEEFEVSTELSEYAKTKY